MADAIRFFKFDEVDEVFDEKGNTFLAMRKIQWTKNDEPDEEKAKIELRKWTVNKDGEEVPLKGFSFLTEEGPNELAKVLVDNGRGDTKELIKSLKGRDDFVEAVNTLYDGEDSDDAELDGEYFDARTALLS